MFIVLWEVHIETLKQFKLTSDQAHKLLNNPGTTIKRGLSKPKARDIKLALAKRQILCRIEAIDEPAPSKISLANQALRIQLEEQPNTRESNSCPKCQKPTNRTDSCEHCGVIFAKFETKQQSLPSSQTTSNAEKRYGIAAAEAGQHSTIETDHKSTNIYSRLPLLAGLAIIVLCVMGYNHYKEQRYEAALQASGIMYMDIEQVDSLVSLRVSGKTTIIDFFDPKCQSCQQRSHDLEILIAREPELAVRRFDVSNGKRYYLAANKYGLHRDFVRHARIYDANGQLLKIDKNDDERYASVYIQRWAKQGERPPF